MANPQPEKPRTTPQTAGQSSAAYHAEHSVRPGRTTADEGPKVVVERPPQNPTVRIDRTKLAAMMQAAPPPKVDGLPLSVRIGVALVAGLTVVLVIFVMARSSGIDRATHGSSVTASPAPPPGTREPVPSAAPPVVQPAVSASPAPAASVNNPSASAPAASSEMAPASTSATMAPASPKPRTRPAGPQPPPTHSVDLSEFKTTFH